MVGMKMKKAKPVEYPLISELATRLNFQPVNEELFRMAFTHASYSYEANLPHNERLEFLGDSVLGLIVCHFLYQRYPSRPEGWLARLKATIVSTDVLAGFSKQLQLNQYLMLGHGERRANGSEKKKLLENLFEAFLGAYYLNFGLEAARAFVLPLIEAGLPEMIWQTEALNAKSTLQELTQAQGLIPEYRLVREDGPQHDKTFTVEVVLKREVYGQGQGKTLKEAQSSAAIQAVEKFKKQR
jgi:ribonuclease III